MILLLLAAVPEFGVLDTVGHLPLVSALPCRRAAWPNAIAAERPLGGRGAVIAAAWTGGLLSVHNVRRDHDIVLRAAAGRRLGLTGRHAGWSLR